MNDTEGTHDYSGADGESYHANLHALPDESPIFRWISRVRADKLQPWIDENHKVLEIGIGPGWNLAMLRCDQRTGVDRATHLAPGLEKLGIKFYSEEESLPSTSFDAVVLHHVLEHLTDPFSALIRARSYIRDGGALLLVVPFEHERKYRTYQRGDRNRHLYSWNVQTLAALVERSGYRAEVAKLGPAGFDRFAAIIAFRLHLGERTYRLIRHVLQWIFQTKEIVVIARPVGSLASAE